MHETNPGYTDLHGLTSVMDVAVTLSRPEWNTQSIYKKATGDISTRQKLLGQGSANNEEINNAYVACFGDAEGVTPNTTKWEHVADYLLDIATSEVLLVGDNSYVGAEVATALVKMMTYRDGVSISSQVVRANGEAIDSLKEYKRLVKMSGVIAALTASENPVVSDELKTECLQALCMYTHGIYLYADRINEVYGNHPDNYADHIVDIRKQVKELSAVVYVDDEDRIEFSQFITEQSPDAFPFGVDTHMHPDLPLSSMTLEMRELTKSVREYIVSNKTLKKTFDDPESSSMIARAAPGVDMDRFWNNHDPDLVSLFVHDISESDPDLYAEIVEQFTSKYNVEMSEKAVRIYADQLMSIADILHKKYTDATSNILTSDKILALKNSIKEIRKPVVREERIASVSSVLTAAGVGVEFVENGLSDLSEQQLQTLQEYLDNKAAADISKRNILKRFIPVVAPARFHVAKRDGEELYYGDISGDCTSLSLAHSNTNILPYWILDPLLGQYKLLDQNGVPIAVCGVALVGNKDNTTTAVLDSIEKAKGADIQDISDSLDELEKRLAECGVTRIACSMVCNSPDLEKALSDRYTIAGRVPYFDGAHDSSINKAIAVGDLGEPIDGHESWQTGNYEVQEILDDLESASELERIQRHQEIYDLYIESTGNSGDSVSQEWLLELISDFAPYIYDLCGKYAEEPDFDRKVALSRAAAYAVDKKIHKLTPTGRLSSVDDSSLAPLLEATLAYMRSSKKQSEILEVGYGVCFKP
jgi:hypothetical protein